MFVGSCVELNRVKKNLNGKYFTLRADFETVHALFQKTRVIQIRRKASVKHAAYGLQPLIILSNVSINYNHHSLGFCCCCYYLCSNLKN